VRLAWLFCANPLQVGKSFLCVADTLRLHSNPLGLISHSFSWLLLWPVLVTLWRIPFGYWSSFVKTLREVVTFSEQPTDFCRSVRAQFPCLQWTQTQRHPAYTPGFPVESADAILPGHWLESSLWFISSSFSPSPVSPGAFP
jgi:hypothetical protein